MARIFGALQWRQLAQALGADSALVLVGQRPWRSATFTGTRYQVRAHLTGDGDRRLDQLPDHEFALSGMIVVECVAERRVRGPDGAIDADISLLTVAMD